METLQVKQLNKLFKNLTLEESINKLEDEFPGQRLVFQVA